MNRREFLGAIGSTAFAAAIDSPCGAKHADLQPVGEIRSQDGVLRATITVEDAARSVWTAQPNTLDKQGFDLATCRENEQMRYFAGSAPGGSTVWPIQKGALRENRKEPPVLLEFCEKPCSGAGSHDRAVINVDGLLRSLWPPGRAIP